jgi:hypothetical protein
LAKSFSTLYIATLMHRPSFWRRLWARRLRRGFYIRRRLV